MSFLGIEIDASGNAEDAGVISTAASQVTVRVIPIHRVAPLPDDRGVGYESQFRLGNIQCPSTAQTAGQWGFAVPSAAGRQAVAQLPPGPGSNASIAL